MLTVLPVPRRWFTRPGRLGSRAWRAGRGFARRAATCRTPEGGEVMAHPGIATGLVLPTYPPMGDVRTAVSTARLSRLDSVFLYDHFQSLFPASVWKSVRQSARTPSPHALYEYQTLLGSLATRAGRMQLGVAVTEPVRRHPVLIAQAAMTLAHLTKRPPVLGLGPGERENTVPYGLDDTHGVDRLAEALQIIRRCFSSTGPIDFKGKHFRLDGGIMDLAPPPGRTPQIWIAAHGPRSPALMVSGNRAR